MNSVGEYLKSVITVSLISGVISMIAPRGYNKKVFRFICGIFMLLCVIAPIKDIVFDFKLDLNSDNKEYSFEKTEEYITETSENQIKSLVNGCVKQVTGTNASDITVTLRKEDQEYVAENITVILDESYANKADAVKDLIFSKYGLKVQVIT